MASVTFRSITSPSSLALFHPHLLHQLLSTQRALIGLPTQPSNELDLKALSNSLLNAGDRLPRNLIDGLATILELNDDRLRMRIEGAADFAGIDLTPPEGCIVGSTVDIATQVWLAQPEALLRVHAASAIPTARRWETWRCRTEVPPKLTLPKDSSRLLDRWANELRVILSNRHCGSGLKIYCHPTRQFVYFLLHHGASLQRMATHADSGDTSSLLVRPAVTDIVRYEPATGNLGIYLQRHSRWLADALRATFSNIIFKHKDLFTAEQQVHLDVLQTYGRAALDCSGYPNLAHIRFVELEAHFPHSGKLIFKSDDVFDFLDQRDMDLEDLPTPTAAKLKVKMTQGGERTVTLKTPNAAIYQRVGDDDALAEFLHEQGFTAIAPGGRYEHAA
jgi:hypothetical protein